jgi:hypothetical protein
MKLSTVHMVLNKFAAAKTTWSPGTIANGVYN